MPTASPALMLLAAIQAATGSGLPQSRMDALVAAVRPVLPFPGASADGDLPSDNSARSKWFVVWPSDSGETRIIVKANPLHPDTQKAGAEAMNDINRAVAAAERRAQAAYDKALDELRRTGKASDLDTITLDDEGIAGERIDAELEFVVELQSAATFDIATSETPVVTAGTGGPAWMVNIPANTYRGGRGSDGRDHFRAAEARLYFGVVPKPTVIRKGTDPLFTVTLSPSSDAVVVVLRGNEGLVKQLVAGADWAQLVPR